MIFIQVPAKSFLLIMKESLGTVLSDSFSMKMSQREPSLETHRIKTSPVSHSVYLFLRINM